MIGFKGVGWNFLQGSGILGWRVVWGFVGVEVGEG